MEEFGSYIFRVTMTALLCSILTTATPSGGKSWIRLLCGIVLSIAVLTGLPRLSLTSVKEMGTKYLEEGSGLAREGGNLATNSMAAIIIEHTEAYILDKASKLGLSIAVEVEVSRDPVPVPASVTVYGGMSAYHKLQMEHFLETDIGITKENIQWME